MFFSATITYLGHVVKPRTLEIKPCSNEQLKYRLPLRSTLERRSVLSGVMFTAISFSTLPI